MDKGAQLQMVVSQVQGARQQIASLKAQLRELEATVIAVKNQPAELALLSQMGSVMIEVEDREKLMEDLELTLGQMKSAIETMAEKETELISTYEQLKQSLEG
ncbi:MAG: prefoldin subunit [Candidatus Poseidoniales archaeon]|jgi:chaperonin cofactor prefoldin